jgi:hypothetical protein
MDGPIDDVLFAYAFFFLWITDSFGPHIPTAIDLSSPGPNFKTEG